MARLKYNLDEISEYGVEPGKYRARVSKVEQTLSKKSRKPMLIWTWKVLAGPEKGKEIKSYTLLSPGDMGNFKTHMLALGNKGKINVDTNTLPGKTAIIVVIAQPSTRPGQEDTDFASVANVLPDNKSKPEPEEDEENENEDEVEDEEESEESEADDEADDDEDEEEAEEEAEEEEDEDDDEDEEDEDEEEEPAPRKKKVPAKAKPVLKSKKTAKGKLPFRP